MNKHSLPDYNERCEGSKICFVILHYTETDSLQQTFDIMAQRKVSVHYIIDTDGTLYKAVDESKRAWHAGKSYWRKIKDINSYSIGIELQNDGKSDFPKAQLEALVILLKDIIFRHDIRPCDILAHSDVAPSRKSDPGEKFPWAWLAEQGAGFFPTEAKVKDAEKDEEITADDLEKYISLIGYGECSLKEAITAFQRRYRPAKIDGLADDETAVLAKTVFLDSL